LGSGVKCSGFEGPGFRGGGLGFGGQGTRVGVCFERVGIPASAGRLTDPSRTAVAAPVQRVRVQGPGSRVQGSGFRVQGSGFKVQGSGFRVQGPGFSAPLRNTRHAFQTPKGLSHHQLLSHRKVDVRLPEKRSSNSHGARTVHLIITMIKWIRTSRL